MKVDDHNHAVTDGRHKRNCLRSVNAEIGCKGVLALVLCIPRAPARTYFHALKRPLLDENSSRDALVHNRFADDDNVDASSTRNDEDGASSPTAVRNNHRFAGHGLLGCWVVLDTNQVSFLLLPFVSALSPISFSQTLPSFLRLHTVEEPHLFHRSPLSKIDAVSVPKYCKHQLFILLCRFVLL